MINSVKIGNETISLSGNTVDLGSTYVQATDGINTTTYSTGVSENGALRLSTNYTNCCTVPPATLIAEYHFDETTWNGTTNETKDSAGYSGGPFDGQGVGTPKPTAVSNNPARPVNTSQGSCGYAYLQNTSNGSAFTLDNLPVNTASGSSTSVSFWMYWNGNPQTMVVMGFNTYYLLFRSGFFGFGSGASDLYGISASGLANGWHHVVGVFNDSNVTNSKLYIDGTLQSLSQRAGSPNNSNAQVTNLITVGGWGYIAENRFDGGYIDEVKVYNGAVIQTQVDENYTETHLCPGFLLPVDNLALSATVATSFVSPWEYLEGVNDNVATTTSHVYPFNSGGPKGYGNWNWPGDFGKTNWVSFEWPTAKSLTSFQVLWWDDTFFGGELLRPTNAIVEFWNGSAWVSLGNIGTALHTFNTLTINNVITTKIRVAMSSPKSTGIIEVRIFGTEAGELIAEYHLDEASWNGTANETKDTAGYSGGPFDGQGIGSPKPTGMFSSPARSGTTGTCGYASLSGSTNGGSAFILDNLPVSTTAENKTSVSFWMYWDGTSTVMPIGWGTYDLLSMSGHFGFNTANADIYGISSTGLSNGWHHVVAVFTNGGVTSNKIYIDNVEKALSQRTGSPLNNLAITQSTLQISGWANTNNNINEYRFSGSRIDEVKVYNGAVTQAQVTADYNATHLCPTYVTNINANRFNCIAEQETNVNTGKLYTQLANTSFNIKVIALKTDGTAETSLSAASDRTAVLHFKDQVTNTTINFSGGETVNSKNVLFTTANNTGIVPVTGITISNAYRNLRCEISEASVTTPSASSDNFAVRPVALTLSSTNASEDAAGTSSTTSLPTKTGASFNLTATAKNAANATLNNYNGTPVIHPWTNPSYLWIHSGGIVKGTLAGSFSAASAGVASGNFTYTEVGYFRLGTYAIYDADFTAVDQSTDCINTAPNEYANTAINGKYGCKFSNTADTTYFGRFIPDHFAITSSMSTNTCGAFNYYGQDGVSTTFVLSAQKISGSDTNVAQNYSGAFAKLPLNAWSSTTGFRFAATGLTSGTLSSGALAPTGSWTNGVTTVTAMHKIARLATPMNPATVSITAQPTDSDGVTMPTATLASNIPFRYGRIGLKNAYGSELHNLTIPIEAQYWDGTTYRRNTLDNCTSTTTPNITLSNYKKNLNAGETMLSGGGLMNQGKSSFTLSKPGAGNSGTVDLSFSLTNFPWMSTGNLAARATFGLYKSPIIYMRENF